MNSVESTSKYGEYTDQTFLRTEEIEIRIIWNVGQKEWMQKNGVHVVFNHGAWHAKKAEKWLTEGFNNPIDCISHAINQCLDKRNKSENLKCNHDYGLFRSSR